MTRECNSQFLFTDQYFHIFSNMRMTDEFPHWIPSVVLLLLIRRCIREVHCHPRSSTEKVENEGNTYASTEPNTQHNRAARTRRDTGILRETKHRTRAPRIRCREPCRRIRSPRSDPWRSPCLQSSSRSVSPKRSRPTARRTTNGGASNTSPARTPRWAATRMPTRDPRTLRPTFGMGASSPPAKALRRRCPTGPSPPLRLEIPCHKPA